MIDKYTPKQNHASRKVYNLLVIATDIAEGAELFWLVEELRRLETMTHDAHREANKHTA